MTHQATRRRNHHRDGHPITQGFAVSCQCPICTCQRPVEAKADGLSICDECRKKHNPVDSD